MLPVMKELADIKQDVKKTGDTVESLESNQGAVVD